MSSTTYTADAPRTSTLLPMMIIGMLFFIMGFFTWLNGPLISFVKVAFTLDDINAFLVPFAFYVSYFRTCAARGAVLKRTGMKKGMVLGLFVMALGAALFGEFVRIRIYPGA
jgi:FHS family L-fucose permease-like MFS transporter